MAEKNALPAATPLVVNPTPAKAAEITAERRVVSPTVATKAADATTERRVVNPTTAKTADATTERRIVLPAMPNAIPATVVYEMGYMVGLLFHHTIISTPWPS
ncbi:hypothetical protein P691DRAFT_782648 [Macrolepiota fuliginosa MF-IS2]|uniref:Uncharacterized protein n=1 Tax=Macrolepiota fuliginosa MF-IS2 TaxID=1400762 RepID=A0A9P5X9B8_9AGAR|nr:hypothetical protein P691DRAFT_782648 [Macrolepiota fuliginosa MF-IS2]